MSLIISEEQILKAPKVLLHDHNDGGLRPQSMIEIAELVGLWHNRQRTSASVKQIAQKHVIDLSQRIEAMQAMQRTLASLLDHCHGDERPDCPILDDLAGSCCRPGV